MNPGGIGGTGTGVLRRTEPTRHVYRGHHYVPANRSDIRVLFARVRREQDRQRIPTPFD